MGIAIWLFLYQKYRRLNTAGDLDAVGVFFKCYSVIEVLWLARIQKECHIGAGRIWSGHHASTAHGVVSEDAKKDQKKSQKQQVGPDAVSPGLYPLTNALQEARYCTAKKINERARTWS